MENNTLQNLNEQKLGFNLRSVNAAMAQNPAMVEKYLDRLLKNNCVYDEQNRVITDRATFNNKNAVVVHSPYAADHYVNAVIMKTPGKKDYGVMFSRFMQPDSCLECVKMMNAKNEGDYQEIVDEIQTVLHYGATRNVPMKKSCQKLITEKMIDLGYVVDPLGNKIEKYSDLKPGLPYMFEVLSNEKDYWKVRETFMVNNNGQYVHRDGDFDNLLNDKNAYGALLEEYYAKTSPKTSKETAADAYRRHKAEVYNELKHQSFFEEAGSEVKELAWTWKSANGRAWEREMLGKALESIEKADSTVRVSGIIQKWNDKIFDEFVKRPEVSGWLNECREEEIKNPGVTTEELLSKPSLTVMKDRINQDLGLSALETLQNRNVSDVDRQRALTKLTELGYVYEPMVGWNDVPEDEMKKTVTGDKVTRRVYDQSKVSTQFFVKMAEDDDPILFTQTLTNNYTAQKVENRFFSDQFATDFMTNWQKAQDKTLPAADRKAALRTLWQNGCMYDENNRQITLTDNDRNHRLKVQFHPPLNSIMMGTGVIDNPFMEVNALLEQEKQERERAEREQAEKERLAQERAAQEQAEIEKNAKDLSDRLSTGSYQSVLNLMTLNRKVYEKVDGKYQSYADDKAIDYSKTIYVSPENRTETYAFRLGVNNRLKMFTITEQEASQEYAQQIVDRAQDLISGMENGKLDVSSNKLNDLLRDRCFYDEKNHLISTAAQLEQCEKVQIHSPLGDDTITTGVIANPFMTLQAMANRKLEENVRVITDPSAEQIDRQLAIDTLTAEGFAFGARGDFSGTEFSADTIGNAFTVRMPYAKHNSYCYQKTVSGEFATFKITDDMRQTDGTEINKIENTSLKNNLFSLTDEKDIYDLKDKLAQGRLYDENDRMITDEAMAQSKNAMIYHKRELDSRNSHMNGIILRDPDTKKYSVYYTTGLERKDFYVPLTRIMNGETAQVSAEELHNVLDRVFTLQTSELNSGQVLTLGTETIRKAVLAQMVHDGLVVDPTGKEILNVETAMKPGKRFMIQHVAGDRVYREGFEMGDDGTVKRVAENLDRDKNAYFDFVKSTIPEPKKPNFFLRAFDAINRAFGGSGLESCNKYRADKLAAERKPFEYTRKATFGENSGNLYREKSAELKAWELGVMKEALQNDNPDLAAIADDAMYETVREDPGLQAYLDEAQRELEATYNIVPRGPMASQDVVNNAAMSEDVETYEETVPMMPLIRTEFVEVKNNMEYLENVKAEGIIQAEDFFRQAVLEDELFDEELNNLEEEPEEEDQVVDWKDALDRRAIAKANREKYMDKINEIDAKNAQKEKTETVKPVEEVKSNDSMNLSGSSK